MTDPSRKHPSGTRNPATATAPHERAQAFLAAIVESSNDAIVGKTLEGRIRSWNPAAERLFGYAADEAVGRSIELIIPPERRHEEQEILSRIRSGQRIEHFETRRVRKDGTLVDVSLTISPVVDDDGAVLGASKIARDIGERKRNEQAAARARRELEGVIEASPVAIWVTDTDGRVQLWSSAAERIFGWPKDEVVGHRIPICDEDHPQIAAYLGRMLAGEVISGAETVARRKDGDSVDVQLWCTGLAASHDQADRFIAMAVDTSVRKRAERELAAHQQRLHDSEERFRTLANHIAQLVWMADEEGSAFWFNKRWLEYTGTTLEQVRGWGWQRAHHPDHVERVLEGIQGAFRSGTAWEDTFPLRAEDGRYRWFLSRAVPIVDERGKIVRWLTTHTDITERMAMEDALREADRRKDTFIATISHELRNPLAAIRMSVEVLAMGRDREHDERVLHTLDRQTSHLVRLVDDLLDVSRINRDKLELRSEELELQPALQRAVEAVRPAIDERGHELILDFPEKPIRLRGDETRIAQIFVNLLNNAARYTSNEGTIRIVAMLEEEHAVIRVIDNGRGMSRDTLDNVFDLFVQSDAAAHDDGGLGIGLTLVRSLVELHGGHVEARSNGPGEGSEIVVRLPTTASTRAPRTSIPDSDAGAAAPSLRILVADDNADAADTLSLLLSSLGHEVYVTYGGAEALATAEQAHPHLALLDLGMPEVDGFEVARTLRRTPWGRVIMLVAVTGWGQDADRERTRNAGFDHHLVKPVDASVLEALLAEARVEA